MKHLLTVMSCFAVLSMSAQMTHVSYEVDTVFTQPTTDLNVDLQGYVVYDVFAHFTNPSDELSSIFSDNVPALDTSPFYVDAPCGCFNPELGDVLLGGEQNPALISVFPEIEFDTYWTLGFAGGEQYAGWNLNYNSTSMCSEEEPVGVIFTVMPQSADEDLKIQIAQITTCGDFELNACFQIFESGDPASDQLFCMDVDGSGPLVVIADVEGCTDPTSCNYDSNAVDDDGSCTPNSLGCMDPTACNFLDTATCDSGECIESGCMDELACNYNPNAGCSDESCLYAGPLGCGPGTVWDEETLRCIVDENVCDDGTYWDASTLSCKPIETCEDDLDGDGLVGVNDLMQLLSSYGTDCPLVEPAEWACGDPVSYYGHDYETVLIGAQCWFAENSRYIPAVSPASDYSMSQPRCHVYGYNGPAVEEAVLTAEYGVYGALYNYTATLQWEICPSNWHIPTDTEWCELESTLGLSAEAVDQWGWRGSPFGDALKSISMAGNNSSGFNALPAGRASYGTFSELGNLTYFWSSSLYDSNAMTRALETTKDQIHKDDYVLNLGISVRCIKD